MDAGHEKLLEAFEEFEVDLEVEQILEKVKRELEEEEESFAEFAERLKELEPEKVEAQKRRAEEAVRLEAYCYPHMTCDWYIEGLDYCWTNWHHQFKRPATPPRAPPPSPDVPRKTVPQPPSQTPRQLPSKRRRRR